MPQTKIREVLYGLNMIDAIKEEKQIDKNIELEKLTIIDPLTGLLNRRYFDENYYVKVGEYMRNKIPISVMFLDLDYFKKVNDTY